MQSASFKGSRVGRTPRVGGAGLLHQTPLRRPSTVARRSSVVDLPCPADDCCTSEWSERSEEQVSACCSGTGAPVEPSQRSGTPIASSTHDVLHASRLALERAYLSFDWSRAMPLVSLEGRMRSSAGVGSSSGGVGGSSERSSGGGGGAAAGDEARLSARDAAASAAAAAAASGAPPLVFFAAQQQAEERTREQQLSDEEEKRRREDAGGPPPPSPPGGGNDPRERSPDYYANVGDAIRTLREDIPMLFQRDLNYSIYRDDVTFRDPRNSFSGIRNYRTIFWSLRFHGRIFFSRLRVEVRRIWQTEDGSIRMRWTVHGVPRVPWEAEGSFDGISQYKLDREGRIYEHAVDNVILRDPPVGVLPWLLSVDLRAQQQQAVPGAFFEAPPAASAAAIEGGAAASAAAAAAGTAACSAAGDAAHGGGEQQQQQPHLHQPRQQQQQARGAASGVWQLLARFSFVRLYAAACATMRLLQGPEQLRLQHADDAA